MINQRYIIVVIVLGTIALFGLASLQYYWMHDSYKQKEIQLEQNLIKSMYGIRKTVAKNEAMKRMSRSPFGNQIKDHLHRFERRNSPSTYKIDTIYAGDGSIAEINIEENDTLGQRHFKAHYSGTDNSFVMDMMEDLFSFSPFSRLEDNLSFHELDSIVKEELKQNGVTSDFETAVFDRFGTPVIFKDDANVNSLKFLANSRFTIPLLSKDFMGPEYILSVDIRDKKGAVLSSMIGTLSLTMILMLLVIAIFYFTVSTILKQKKVSIIKNDFINNMTHELKTPISTISLACEMLSDNTIIQSEEQKRSFVGMIREENKRLGNLVESVLQTAIIDKGELKFKPEKISLHQIIEQAVKNISIQVEQKGGKISQKLNAKFCEIEGDKTHLTNIVFNLLDNANKYSLERPDITIATEDVVGGVILKVIDKGIGISSDNQYKIFEKLYRVPTGNVHNVKGFGLGLSYVKAIVDKHGGNIRVESELDKGSTFIVFLPKTLKHEQN